MDNLQEGKIVILAIAIVVILGCFILLLFIIFVKQKNIVIRNKEKSELNFKQELIKTQTEIQKETMKHIGREIHDNVGQKLTLTSIYLQQLIFENKAPHINENITTINAIVNESLSQLRLLSKSLTDDTIQVYTLEALLENECKKIEDLKAYKVECKNSLEANVTSYKTKSILLRIVQEFFQNSIKHAQCKTIKLTLSNTLENIVLSVEDDGKGFNVKHSNSNGIGLVNIKSRIEMLNGTYELLSDTNGTKLTIKIPINDA